MNLLRLFQRAGGRLGLGRSGPVGLHFAEQQVHAAQFALGMPEDVNLKAWASADPGVTRAELLGDARRVKSLLQQLWRDAGFSGRRVVAAMPPDKLRITPLTFTADPRSPDEEKIVRLMGERLDGAIADFVLDYVPVRCQPSETERVVLVAACRRDDAIGFLDCLQAAGLDVAALQISPVAINRLICALPGADAQRTILVINFGHERSFLTAISGRRLLLDQDVAFGEHTLLDRIGRTLELDRDQSRALVLRRGLVTIPTDADVSGAADADALAEIVRPALGRLSEEVRRVGSYVASKTQGSSIERVYVLGSIARWPGAAALMSRALGLPVQDELPVSRLAQGRGVAGEAGGVSSELAVAMGLGLYGG